MFTTQTLTDVQKRALAAAVEVLAAHAPAHLDHVRVHIERLEYVPGGCRSEHAIACTNVTGWGQAILFEVDPAGIELIDLAVVLSHEGRHWSFDANGNRISVPHTCIGSACRDEQWRRIDPIYRDDAALEVFLRARTGIRKAAPGPSIGEQLLVGVGIGALAFFGGVAIAALGGGGSGPTYDRRVDRYRDALGRFSEG